MTVKTHKLKLETNSQFEILNITVGVSDAVGASGIKNGMCLIFSPHTTAAVRINQDEPLLHQDILKVLYRLMPVDANYAHDIFEIRGGPSGAAGTAGAGERSNGHAHAKAFLLGSSETIPIADGRLMLGPHQSIFFVELDGAQPARECIIQIVGE